MVRITSSDLIAIQSYYHRRVEDAAGSEPSLEQQLWGFTADSSLPVSAARARLEYSVWMPPGSAQDGFGDEQNRLIRLRLNDHRRFFDYGANFFAVGEAFAQNAMARERLNASGLPGAGEGAELWVAGRVPGVGIKPRFRRLAKSLGNATLINETYGVAYDHGIGGRSRLLYLLESSDASTWFEDPMVAGQLRESEAATVTMRTSAWTMFLKNLRFDEEFEAGRRETGSVWELGGTLNVFAGLSLSPLLSNQIRDVGADDYLHASSAGLTLHTTWIEPMAVDLHLQRNRRDTLQGTGFEGTAADLKVRTPLWLWDRTLPGIVMIASLGYRGMEGLAGPVPEEGMSFRLTVDFQPGR
jgi:hypothetical protein